MMKKFNRELPGLCLTLLLAAFPFLFLLLAYFFGIPMWKMHNAAGVAAMALLAALVCSWKQFGKCEPQVKWMLASALVFFGLTLVGQILGYQDYRYYLAGLNNNGRFFIFFFGCVLFLRAEHRDSLMKVWDVLFWVNFVLSLYQYFVLGIKWDNLGGIFGTEPGCNAYTNVFFMVSTSLSILRYMSQQEKAWQCLLRCAAALIVTALSELKMFVLEFAGILVLAMLLTKFNRRKLILLMCGGLGLLACIRLMIFIFPMWADWFNLRSIWETATASTGYTGAGDWNRLTAVPIAWNEYLLTMPQKLFGLGLGNCDFSTISGWSSPFYADNYMSNYTQFSSGLIMLETGLVGMIAYVGFFLVVFWSANSLRRSGRGDAVYCQLTEVMALMSLVLFIYNCTLRTETGYMVFFTLALAFVRGKETQKLSPERNPGDSQQN